MNLRSTTRLAFLTLVSCLLIPGRPAIAQSELNVYIRAGEATHGPEAHNYPTFLKQWKQLLRNRGITVDGSLSFPDPDHLAEAA